VWASINYDAKCKSMLLYLVKERMYPWMATTEDLALCKEKKGDRNGKILPEVINAKISNFK
jgi:hypothetical protein